MSGLRSAGCFSTFFLLRISVLCVWLFRNLEFFFFLKSRDGIIQFVQCFLVIKRVTACNSIERLLFAYPHFDVQLQFLKGVFD